jgi:hypothetical protein
VEGEVQDGPLEAGRALLLAAVAARPAEVQGQQDGVPDLEALDAGTDLVNDAGAFVAGDERALVEGCGDDARLQRQIRVADSDGLPKFSDCT